MRFDDSLQTVLAADATSASGAQSAFRQLVDLLGRRRVVDEAAALERLRSLRADVPAPVRAATARALALAEPSAALVALFAEDEPAVAAPVLRAARLSEAEWLSLLPRIGPAGRALLRARTNLPRGVSRGLEAFGATDFTLTHDGPPSEPDPVVAPPPPRERPNGGMFAIAELVERIETFHRDQDDRPAPLPPPVERFRFETDAAGSVTWVDGVPRAGLVGRRLPGVESGTIGFDLRGPAAGEWIASAAPLFAEHDGRLTGYRGTARRVEAPREPAVDPDALRRLVHELRTPTNAIAGFAELIATAMLGPVAPVHRERADAIGRDVRALIGAIEDLEISARVDGGALDLAPRPVDLWAALAAAIPPGARVRIVAESGLQVLADERALARLLHQLATVMTEATADDGETLVSARGGPNGVSVAWPWTAPAHDTSLLGTDFALRLAHKLAHALGGRLVTEPQRLTLHLPSAFNMPVQATNR